MSSALFDTLHSGLQTVVGLRLKQHALTSSNVSNVDTPGYRARALDFSTALDQAVRGEPATMNTTDPRHMGPDGGSGLEQLIEYEELPWAGDDSSVLLERENARLTENALMLNAVSDGLSRRLAMLRFAASDGQRR